MWHAHTHAQNYSCQGLWEIAYKDISSLNAVRHIGVET